MSKAFGAETTTDDVLEGIDLAGKRVLVTGVSAGLGVETARTLAAHGAQVVGAARNLDKAHKATEAVRAQAKNGGGLELVELDLASLTSVRACADALVADGKGFDAVIANAGVMATPQGKTADGFEMQFGTNHLGHFVLVNRIASLMKSGSRLVNLSSSGHRFSDVDLDDPNFERTPYTEFGAYGRSKTANVLFAVEFDRRHKARGIRATAVHPGGIQTELGRYMTPDVIEGMIKSINESTPAGAPRSNGRRSRKAPLPRYGRASLRRPIWSAASSARTATWRRLSKVAISARAFVPMRSIPSMPRHSGPRAKRWWASGSPDRMPVRAGATRARGIPLEREHAARRLDRVFGVAEIRHLVFGKPVQARMGQGAAARIADQNIDAGGAALVEECRDARSELGRIEEIAGHDDVDVAWWRPAQEVASKRSQRDAICRRIQFERDEANGIDLGGRHGARAGFHRRNADKSGARAEIEHAAAGDGLRPVENVTREHQPPGPGIGPIGRRHFDAVFTLADKAPEPAARMGGVETDFRQRWHRGKAQIPSMNCRACCGRRITAARSGSQTARSSPALQPAGRRPGRTRCRAPSCRSPKASHRHIGAPASQ